MTNDWQTFLAQQSATNKKATDAIIDLSYLGLIKVTGPDAKKLLQGQLTCNLDEITETESRLGAHCSPKGRIISLFRLFYWHEAYYLQMPRETIPLAMSALKKYAVFYKVQLADASDEWICLGYMGDTLNQIIPELPSQRDQVKQCHECLIINIPGDLLRYEILGTDTALTALWDQLATHANLAAADRWREQDLKAHLPHIFPETSEVFLPHELDLPNNNGVSFNKGCYTGQEIIARMQYRGKLKSGLTLLTIEKESTPLRGSDLEQTNNVIVDYCQIDTTQFAVLVLTPHVTT